MEEEKEKIIKKNLGMAPKAGTGSHLICSGILEGVVLYWLFKVLMHLSQKSGYFKTKFYKEDFKARFLTKTFSLHVSKGE